MTVRARRALAEADVVVTDRLGPVSALARLPDTVEVIDVGKAPGATRSPDEINRIIVEQARRGRTVVRLKGGDPFLRPRWRGGHRLPGTAYRSRSSRGEQRHRGARGGGIPVTQQHLGRGAHHARPARSRPRPSSASCRAAPPSSSHGRLDARPARGAAPRRGRSGRDAHRDRGQGHARDAADHTRGPRRHRGGGGGAGVETPAVIVIGATAAADLLGDDVWDAG